MGERVLTWMDDGSQAARIWNARGPASTWAADGLGEPVPLPRVAVMLVGDGRDELRDATVSSFLAHLFGYTLGAVVEVDDRHHELGFGGAIRAGWRALRGLELDAWEMTGRRAWDYVFHLEEDWRFLEPVDMRWLAAILDGDDSNRAQASGTEPPPGSPPPIPNPSEFPRIAQAALRRGPVNAAERAAGGVVESWPAEYLDAGVITPEAGAVPYLQHRLYFTTNPSLYRTELMMLDWPDGPGSEAAFTRELLAWGYAFALYGARSHPPVLEHTGVQRTGTGY